MQPISVWDQSSALLQMKSVSMILLECEQFMLEDLRKVNGIQSLTTTGIKCLLIYRCVLIIASEYLVCSPPGILAPIQQESE